MTVSTRLPPTARAWAASQLGPGARVVRARRLRGATATAVHAVDVDDGADRRHRLVLRRFVDRAWLAREPYLAAREAAVLTHLRSRGIRAPELVGADTDGSAAGAPAVLSTRLRGRIDLQPTDRSRWLRGLADALAPVHDLDGAGLPRYQPYGTALGPPPWSPRRAVWERAAELVDRGPGAGHTTLIHRDYHPLNTLWSRGCLTGIVDWVSGCTGDPGVDIGHCRVNLAMLFGLDAADEFAPDADPYWDLASATDGLAWDLPTASFRDAGRTDLDDAILARRLDVLVATALSRLEPVG